MDEKRDLLIALAWRSLLAVPLVLAAWFLFKTTTGDSGGAGKRVLGLVCVVVAGIVVARPLAGLVAEPTGSLFYPRRTARREPLYSVADAKRKQGRYTEAVQEYEKIAEQFPAEVRSYVAMMEIACVNLHDTKRADAIAKRGFAALRDDASRNYLLHAHRTVMSAAASPAPAVAPDNERDDTESDSEGTR